MNVYAQAVLKFLKLDTQTQQCEVVVRGRSLASILASLYKKFIRSHLICSS
ncbi:MAG: hypothetical protein LBJ00_01970 [Planctomycetaceae bacterium]|nr:hypothetical protein [Planctomycetaceae bacterium]